MSKFQHILFHTAWDNGDAKKTFPLMSAFSTSVENSDALLENAQKMRKNVQIRNSLLCPHFPL